MTVGEMHTYDVLHFPVELLHIANAALKAEVHVDCLHAGLLFTLDIFLLFHTGFIITCNLRKRLIMDGYFVARYYAKHASLLVDVLATIPSWIEVSELACMHAGFSFSSFLNKMHGSTNPPIKVNVKLHTRQHCAPISCKLVSLARMLMRVCLTLQTKEQLIC